MDTDYILALIRRRDMGIARDLLWVLALMDGGQIGKLIHAPVPELAAVLECHDRTVERYLRQLIRFNTIQRVGKQGLRRLHVTTWRREPLQTDRPCRDKPTYGGGINRHTVAAESRHTVSETDIPCRGPKLSETDRQRVSETDTPDGFPQTPSLKDLKGTKDIPPPQTANGNGTSAGSSPAPECPMNSQSGTANGDRRKAYYHARQAVAHLALDRTDVSGLANELERLANKHPSKDYSEGLASAVALLEDLTSGETAALDGAELIGAMRNRWTQWCQPGGTLPDALAILAADQQLSDEITDEWAERDDAPEEGGVADAKPTAELGPEGRHADEGLPSVEGGDGGDEHKTGQEENDVKITSDDNDTKPITVDELLEMGSRSEGAGQRRGTRDSGAEGEREPVSDREERRQREIATAREILEPVLEYARAHPTDEPGEHRELAREVDRIVVVFWRRLDGRESLQLVGSGNSSPHTRRQRIWATAAWPGAKFAELERDDSPPAVTLTTPEVVEP